MYFSIGGIGEADLEPQPNQSSFLREINIHGCIARVGPFVLVPSWSKERRESLQVWRRGLFAYYSARKFLSRTQDSIFTRAITSLPRKVAPAVSFSPSIVSLFFSPVQRTPSQEQKPRRIFHLRCESRESLPQLPAIAPINFLYRRSRLLPSLSVSPCRSAIFLS